MKSVLIAFVFASTAALACDAPKDEKPSAIGHYVQKAFSSDGRTLQTLKVQTTLQMQDGSSKVSENDLTLMTIADIEIDLASLKGDNAGTVYFIENEASFQRLQNFLKAQYCGKDVATDAYYYYDRDTAAGKIVAADPNLSMEVDDHQHFQTKVRVKSIDVPYYNDGTDVLAMCDASQGTVKIVCD